jgi:hypothetical protein
MKKYESALLHLQEAMNAATQGFAQELSLGR